MAGRKKKSSASSRRGAGRKTSQDPTEQSKRLDARLDCQVELEHDNEFDRYRDGCERNGILIPGPLYWMQHLTKTYDEHWQAKGLASPYNHFPDLPYLPWLFNLFLHCRRLLVPKSREMLVSWSVVGYAVWKCQLYPRTRVVIQCQKQEKSNELVKGSEPPGYARTLYDNQQDWLKLRFRLAARMADMPANKIAWANGSVIHGIPSGADQIRLYHPTILIADEAAHMDDFAGSWDAADPVCSQIIAVSSAAPSWFGDECQSAEWYY